MFIQIKFFLPEGGTGAQCPDSTDTPFRIRSKGCGRDGPNGLADESHRKGFPGGRGIREMVRVKRIYDEWERSDGVRILVDRLWPRGIGREEARIDEWRKDLAPTGVLREWFGHDPRKWEEFRVRYRNELEAAGKMKEVEDLGERASKENVTLLYAARDGIHNNAVALMKMIGKRSRRPTAA